MTNKIITPMNKHYWLETKRALTTFAFDLKQGTSAQDAFIKIQTSYGDFVLAQVLLAFKENKNYE